MLPSEGLAMRYPSVCILLAAQTVLLKGYVPSFFIKLFVPRIESCAVAESGDKNSVEPSVTACKAGFKLARFREMAVEFDTPDTLERAAQKRLTAQNLFRGYLRLPLEGGKRLRNKGRCRYRAPEPLSAHILGHGVEGAADLSGKLRDTEDILIGLGRKSDHEIELNAVPAGTEGIVHSSEQVILVDAFIYDVAQPLRSRFGCKGETGLAYLLHLLKIVLYKGINAQRRQGNGYAVLAVTVKDFRNYLMDFGIVAA